MMLKIHQNGAQLTYLKLLYSFFVFFRNHTVTVYKIVLVTMRFYATGAFQQVNGDMLGLHKSTVSRIVKNISRELRFYQAITLKYLEITMNV